MPTYQIKPVNDFHLAHTLRSGQVFRWRKVGDTYYGFIGENLVGLKQDGNAIHVESAQNSPRLESQVTHYLGLNDNLRGIVKTLPHDEHLSPLISRYWGLRVIRQDPWECLASFILSSFNNIKRIQGMIEAICQRYGTPKKWGRFYLTPTLCFFYTFPKPEAIATSSESVLRRLGLGFRAPYLLATARLVDSGALNLETLKKLGYDEIKEKLLACPGVGEKVVECILLFAYQQWQAFPVDVWIERLLRRYYFPRRKISAGKLQEWARVYFGPFAGYAQQYFYCSTRL